MKRYVILPLLLFFALVFASETPAGQIKTYVAKFAVAGAPNGDELRVTFQTLLASRLTGEYLLAADCPFGAEMLVSGSYTAVGSGFSLDAVVKNSAGNMVTRAFVQGVSQDELLPAVGKLAQSLTEAIVNAGAVPERGEPPPAAKPEPTAPVTLGGIREEPVGASAPVIIKVPAAEKVGAAAWISRRLEGAARGLALGRTLENGDKELYIADQHSLKLYRLAKELTLVCEVSLKKDEDILAIDTCNLDGNGVPELYVTIQSAELLSSQIWEVRGNTFVRVAEKLPYFFRGMALNGGEKKIYVQQLGRDADFYGDVYELVKDGEKYEMKNPLKLPRYGFLYNFSQFADAAGRLYYVILHETGNLIVYNREGEELWRSRENYGGSEVYFKRYDGANVRITGDPYRWIYLEQRIVVTREGEILVPQNSADWVLGKAHSYRNGTVRGFVWNGAALEEKWHTKDSQNYLADFGYDQEKKELILLQVVKKDGLLGRGSSTVAIRRVE